MRSLLSMAAASVLLSACTTTQLTQACNAIDTAHAAFVIVADTGKVKQSTVTKESAVHNDVAAACAAATVASAQ